MPWRRVRGEGVAHATMLSDLMEKKECKRTLGTTSSNESGHRTSAESMPIRAEERTCSDCLADNTMSAAQVGVCGSLHDRLRPDDSDKGSMLKALPNRNPPKTAPHARFHQVLQRGLLHLQAGAASLPR